MKKVILLSILALVCTAVMTSCGDDDKSVPLTGLNVAPRTIKLPVGGEQKITVTAVPADATEVAYTWTSQNTSIATVDANGLVKIVGVGSTTVTVSGGAGVSADITVEGTLNSLTVTDENGSNSGTYAYNGQPISINLTANLVPPAAGQKPTWTSSAANATIEAAADGLTAVATLTGEGAVIITATVGDISGTYAISTTSVFESADGYWTFDDPANLGKATRGSDLIVHSVEVVPGPSETKGAVQTKDFLQAFEWEHNFPPGDFVHVEQWYKQEFKIADEVTLLFDIDPRSLWDLGPSKGWDRAAAPLYWNGSHTTAAFWMRWYVQGGPEGSMNIYANGNRWSYDEAKTGWQRVVIKLWPVREGEAAIADGFLPNIDYHRDVYIDGKSIGDLIRGNDNGYSTYFRPGFVEGAHIWFLSESNQELGTEDYNNPIPCSTIAVWNRLLTEEEIAQLGGVSK